MKIIRVTPANTRATRAQKMLKNPMSNKYMSKNRSKTRDRKMLFNSVCVVGVVGVAVVRVRVSR